MKEEFDCKEQQMKKEMAKKEHLYQERETIEIAGYNRKEVQMKDEINQKWEHFQCKES